MRTTRMALAGFVAAVVGLGAFLPLASRGDELTLEQCLAEAQRNNRLLKVSRLSIEIAEAQHRQALSGYWPQIGARAGYTHLGAAPDFLFPASTFSVPAGTATVTIPAGVIGPSQVQLPVSTPAQSIAVPDQRVKLADPDNLVISANATWLLYDGGLRRGYSEQAESLVAMSRQDARRTDLEVADSVTRLYYGAVLARELVRTAQATEQKLGATLELTTAMYKGNTAKVSKMDWLDTRVMVATVRSMLAELEKNQSMAEAALAITMGRPWSASVQPADTVIPFAPQAARLEELVEVALRSNPDWLKVQAALRAIEGGITTARSEHLPKLALTGDARRWWNGYDAGLVTDHNKNSWSVGVGVELPIFTGFATRNKVAEAERRFAKLQEEQALLREGMGLRIREAFLDIGGGEKAVAAAGEAREAAAENCDLAIRAYQSGLVDTEKVIRAQITEALSTAQHLKALYDHAAAGSRLHMLVGGAASGDR